jgi:hypothetical protein
MRSAGAQTWRRSASTSAWSFAWSRWLVAIASRRIRRIEYSLAAITARDSTGSTPTVSGCVQGRRIEFDELSAPHTQQIGLHALGLESAVFSVTPPAARVGVMALTSAAGNAALPMATPSRFQARGVRPCAET